MRRHRQQMSQAERNLADQFARSLQIQDLTLHTAKRMDQKHVTEQDIRSALVFGQVIEISKHSGNLRLLVRHDRRQDAVCVVIEPRTRRVVTTWKNSRQDQHNTLDLSLYSWNTDMRTALEEVR